MDLFGKKRIAELEKENKKLQEEKDSLKLVIDNENNKVRELEIENRDLKINFDSRERALKTLKDDRVEREKQVIELNEELNELIVECDRMLNTNTDKLDYSFLEEVADVSNMIEQLKYLYNDRELDERVIQIRKEKNERTLERIEELEGDSY